MPEAAEAPESAEKKKKKKNKVRSALTVVQKHASRDDARVERADALLQSLLSRRPLPAATLARRYVLIGDRESANRMLEQVLAERTSLQQLKSDPVFDAMRDEPRVAALVRRGSSR